MASPPPPTKIKAYNPHPPLPSLHSPICILFGVNFANHLQVSKLHLHCKRKCGWKGTWGKMREHLKECGLEKKIKMERRGKGRERGREREEREGEAGKERKKVFT